MNKKARNSSKPFLTNPDQLPTLQVEKGVETGKEEKRRVKSKQHRYVIPKTKPKPVCSLEQTNTPTKKVHKNKQDNQLTYRIENRQRQNYVCIAECMRVCVCGYEREYEI